MLQICIILGAIGLIILVIVISIISKLKNKNVSNNDTVSNLSSGNDEVANLESAVSNPITISQTNVPIDVQPDSNTNAQFLNSGSPN